VLLLVQSQDVHGSEIDNGLTAELTDYLRGIMRGFSSTHVSQGTQRDNVPDGIFDLLTSQRYNYLGRLRSEVYRDPVLASVSRDVAENRPVRFYYDLGGGYRASLQPGKAGLIFDVGLAELLALHQVASFCNAVQTIYPPGARFTLVIDNLCALLTNDIPVECTERYVHGLRALIAEVGLDERVDVLVESERLPTAAYEAEFARIEPFTGNPEPTAAEIDNVARFLGRPCTVPEAAARIERYRRASQTTERLLEPVIDGVHLLQRAAPGMPCFRSFPGGDQRIQAGDVALGHNANGKLRPVLLTSRNIGCYRLLGVACPGILAAAVPEVIYAMRSD
jgi:hypothetical protein